MSSQANNNQYPSFLNRHPVAGAIAAFISVVALAACSQAPNKQQVSESVGNSTDASEQTETINGVPLKDTLAAAEAFCQPEAGPAFLVPQYTNIWDRVRAGFALDLSVDNKRVNAELKWLKKNPTYMKRVSERSSYYIHHIVESLDAQDMPLELALLPVVESAYDPFAYSHGRASGMWQFIPGTGKMYGLKQNWWYDGRRDVKASTRAATEYLSYLARRFDGDWLLALAAYNAGQGNVDKAIRRNKKAGKPTDFWSLRLPKETSMYVPRLLALSKLVNDPEAHGTALLEIPNEPYFAAVPIDGQIDLALAAELAGITIEELYRLNPGFNRWATDPHGPFELLVPEANAQQFTDNLASNDTSSGLRWENYRVKNGDTLGGIAQKHKSSVSNIQTANNLNGHMIRVGQQLMIPVPSKGAEHYSLSYNQRVAKKQASQAGKGKQRVDYTIRQGDSFWKIARKFHVSVNQLAKWNGMAPRDPIHPGKTLVVWAEPAAANQMRSLSSPLPSAHIRKVRYSVRRGDSLARIANKFNVAINDIVNWNSVSKSEYLQPGQRLTLYVDVTNVN